MFANGKANPAREMLSKLCVLDDGVILKSRELKKRVRIWVVGDLSKKMKWLKT